MNLDNQGLLVRVHDDDRSTWLHYPKHFLECDCGIVDVLQRSVRPHARERRVLERKGLAQA